MKNFKIITFIIFTFLFSILTACSPLNKNDSISFNKKEKENFLRIVKNKYGENANIKNIKIENNSNLLKVSSYEEKENKALIGTVHINNEKFIVKYLTYENKVLTKKNNEKIKKIISNYFKGFNIIVEDVKIKDQLQDEPWIDINTEDIDDFLQNNSYLNITVFTKSDLFKLDKKSLSKIFQYPNAGNINPSLKIDIFSFKESSPIDKDIDISKYNYEKIDFLKEINVEEFIRIEIDKFRKNFYYINKQGYIEKDFE